MFRLANSTNTDGAVRYTPYPLPNKGYGSYPMKGFNGAASRDGYGSYFGGMERQHQNAKFQREHQQHEGAQAGASYVILGNADGKGVPGLTCEIGGRLCTSGPSGAIRLLDMSYYQKCADTISDVRQHTMKLTAMAMNSTQLCQSMFPDITSEVLSPIVNPEAIKAEYLARMSEAVKGDGTMTTDAKSDVANLLAQYQVPYALLSVSCSPDHIQSLSPYSAEHSNGVAKLQCIIRNMNVATVGEPQGSLAPVTREDANKLATQHTRGKTSIDV